MAACHETTHHEAHIVSEDDGEPPPHPTHHETQLADIDIERSSGEIVLKLCVSVVDVSIKH